jgi:drug/metabolite transporter (DMT)-like permease
MFPTMDDARTPPPPASRLPSALVLACVAATWFVWGSTYLAIKFALAGLPPFLMMAWRFIVAGGLLVAYMRIRGAPWPSALQWRNAVLVGTLMLGCGMGGTAYAEQSIGSGIVVAFIAVTPLLMVLASLPFGIRPAASEVIGILVGLAGVLMLVQGAGFRASPGGLAAMLFASSGWTLGSVLSQRVFHLAPGAMGFGSEMLCGGLVLFVVAAAAGETLPASVPIGAGLAWAYLVVFGSLVAFNAYMYLLGRASAGLATSYTYVNPVIAMMLGVALGGEHVTGWEWLSAGVVLAGVVLVVFSRR